MSDLKNKTILTVACTGAWPKKEDTPYIPITPEEEAEEIIKCAEAGASIAHIHVRDPKTFGASMDYDQFAKTVEIVRANSDIVINLTTSGGLGWPDDLRMKPFIELRPEIASFDCGTMNWQDNAIFENNPQFLEKLGYKMQECNVRPEIEVFDMGMIENAARLVKKGALIGPVHFQFVIGVLGGMAATPENLFTLVDYAEKLHPGCTWGALGVGRGHLPVMLAAMSRNGHLRVGMEDNILFRKGQLAKSNVEFVERTKRMLAEIDKEIATPDEAREILNLKNCNSKKK
jgi:3-keto-5-aminohexanoate cleavage enzyme